MIQKDLELFIVNRVKDEFDIDADISDETKTHVSAVAKGIGSYWTGDKEYTQKYLYQDSDRISRSFGLKKAATRVCAILTTIAELGKEFPSLYQNKQTMPEVSAI